MGGITNLLQYTPRAEPPRRGETETASGDARTAVNRISALESCVDYLLDVMEVPPGALPGRVGDRWEALLRLAERRKLKFYLAAWALEYWKDRLPGNLKDDLRRALAWNEARNVKLSLEITSLARMFRAAGIPVMFIKGAAGLARGLYPSGWRFISDIDVMVKARDCAEAGKLLGAAGYRQIHGEGILHHHLPPLYRPGKAGALEIHLKPYKYILDKAVPDEIWRGAENLAFRGEVFRVPSPTDHLWILLRTDLIEKMLLPRLSDLAEISLLHDLGKPVDYDLLAERAKSEGIPNILAISAASLSKFFQVTLPYRMECGGLEEWEAEGLRRQREIWRGETRNRPLSAGIASLKYLPGPGVKSRLKLVKRVLGSRTACLSLLLSFSAGTGLLSRLRRFWGKERFPAAPDGRATGHPEAGKGTRPEESRETTLADGAETKTADGVESGIAKAADIL